MEKDKKLLIRSKDDNTKDLKTFTDSEELIIAIINTLCISLNDLKNEVSNNKISLDKLVDIKNLYEKIMHEAPFNREEVLKHEKFVELNKGNFDLNLYKNK